MTPINELSYKFYGAAFEDLYSHEQMVLYEYRSKQFNLIIADLKLTH